MLLTAPIPTVDTSPHWFMSLNHQSSESFNSSSSSHYFSTIFAWHTDLRKLVGKRSLKPHKAVLFLSPQFNRSRHRSNTKPQLNFLQAKYWTKRKKKKGGIVASIYDNKLISSQQFVFASLLICSARSDSPEELISHIKSTHCKSQRMMTVFISAERQEGKAESAACCSYVLHNVGIFLTCIRWEKN